MGFVDRYTKEYRWATEEGGEGSNVNGLGG